MSVGLRDKRREVHVIPKGGGFACGLLFRRLRDMEMENLGFPWMEYYVLVA